MTANAKRATSSSKSPHPKRPNRVQNQRPQPIPPSTASSRSVLKNTRSNQHSPRHPPPLASRPVTARPNGVATSSPSPSSSVELTNTAQNQVVLHKPSTMESNVELKLLAKNLPSAWTTREVYRCFSKYGKLVRIERLGRGWVICFMPPPTSTQWVREGLDLTNPRCHAEFELFHRKRLSLKSPKDPQISLPQDTTLPVSNLSFGVMRSEDTMLVLHETKPDDAASPKIVVNLNIFHKVLDVDFTIEAHSFRLRFGLSQLHQITQLHHSGSKQKAWVFSVAQPPMAFRQTGNPEDTHDPTSDRWNVSQTWFRQTEIKTQSLSSHGLMTQLQSAPGKIDVGRWLTYSLIFNESVADSRAFSDFLQALSHHNISIRRDAAISLDSEPTETLWSWLDRSTTAFSHSNKATMLLNTYCMDEKAIHLVFSVRYQLEVCISQGMLHEYNITKEFLAKLGAMDHERAVRLLEKVVDEGKRFYNPDDIFRSLMHKVSVVRKRTPRYAAMIRAAVVTPTTVYFATPALETSNRVVRKYNQHQDRFLRVKFIDEKYRGSIKSARDDTTDEIFTRVKRTMTNGINVAGRHYEFLAFGNSQFREHGAWFFASIGDLTAQKIRDDLGDFESIKVLAKYCSRIGQCFSTTKATRWTVDNEKIPDIERNGFCFTDGVGKISPFLAQMIAQELGYPSAADTFPSAFQFRREGFKGILVVDHSVKGHKIHFRPSQEKFTGAQHHGLEIVRVSGFSAAYLNVQLILVLSALGVEDGVFVEKMRRMLMDLEEAMRSETKAIGLLQKNIDYNHMSVQLASMISDGFMETNDPFTMSCLHLWRTWSVKYLKEKARIFVEKGAFVLGCVDEAATLRGHFENQNATNPDEKNIEALPQIFLQIDPTREGKWKVIEGVVILCRNPSLHPGDIRVVLAVDVPALHHIRDCVVLPQTGDRDLANMCSGGDLDGDDYLVLWDDELLPDEWNHPPMDYSAPAPVLSKGKVTVNDMTSFFVTHMKYDILKPIAVAHKYWADWLEDGVKDPKCLELAQLHSMAVDYAKTGVAAKMPKHLRTKQWPHWSNPKFNSRSTYKSKKVIGQLYDEVERIPFKPLWNLPFDQRILEAYQLDDEVLQAAREAKEQYDETMRRTMAKYGIPTEFEVWSTFVLEHSEDMGDYKFAETIGDATSVLKDTHQKLCYEKAGTDEKERDWSKMGPFIAAMYAVTADQVASAWEECNKKQLRGGRWAPLREATPANMPFMSFPWLFPAELGRIANKRMDRRVDMPVVFPAPRLQPAKKSLDDLFRNGINLAGLEEVKFPGSEGSDTELKLSSNEAETASSSTSCEPPSPPLTSPPLTSIKPPQAETASDLPLQPMPSLNQDLGKSQAEPAKQDEGEKVEEDSDSDSDDEPVVSNIVIEVKKSALDKLEEFLSS